MKNWGIFLSFLFVILHAQRGLAQESATSAAVPLQSTTTSTEPSWISKNMNFNYWAMLSGPSISDPKFSSVDIQGEQFAMNYWQIIGATVNLSKNQQLGIQQRVSVDLGSPQFESDFYLQNPRPIWNIKNIIDNSWLNFGLTNGFEIVTESKWRNRGLITSLMLAQNWTFKFIPEPFSFGVQTALLPMFYNNSTNQPNLRIMAIPFANYLINDTFSIMSWGWFDAEHFADTPFGDWGAMSDDYVRVGVNVNITKNISIYPCVQGFVDQPKLINSTYGLELSAAF